MNRSLILCTASSGASTVVDSSSGATVMNYFSSEDAVLRPSCVAQTGLGFMLQHSNKPHMHLYNWAKKQPTTRCAAPEPILCLCSDASSCFVVAGSASGKAYVWNSGTGDLLAQWNAHFRGVCCVSITHDTAFIVTGGDDGLVQVLPLLPSLPNVLPHVFSLSYFPFNASILTGVEHGISVQRGRRTILLLFGARDAGDRAGGVLRRQPRPCSDGGRRPQRANLQYRVQICSGFLHAEKRGNVLGMDALHEHAVREPCHSRHESPPHSHPGPLRVRFIGCADGFVVPLR